MNINAICNASRRLRDANFPPCFATFEHGFHHLLHLISVAQGCFAGFAVEDAVDKVPGNAVPGLGRERDIDGDVVRDAVLCFVDFERAELRAGFVAKEFDLEFVGLVRCPEAFDLEACAVFKADESASIVVSGVLFVGAARDLSKAPVAASARSKFRAAHACDGDGFGHAE